MENGILDVENCELRPADPKYQFFNKIEVKYDPEAKGLLIDKFHHDVTGNEEDVLVLEEMAGYCLIRDYRYQLASSA